MLIRLVVFGFAVIAGLACAGAGAPPAPASSSNDLPRATDGVLYAIGNTLGNEVKQYQLDADEASEVARGFVDGALARPYAGARGENLPNEVAEWHQLRLQELARREELAGAPALERALREPGAVKTESGMIVNVLDAGAGPSPSIFDIVTVEFEGTLRDGTVFDTSRGKQPAVQQLGTANGCWQQSLRSVGAGARLRVACPPSLGYGWGGWPGVVPGGGVLLYELELVRVEPGKVPPGYNRDGTTIDPP